MIATQRFYKKSSFWIIFFLIGFFLCFMYYFRNEVCAFVYNKPCGPEGMQTPNRSAGFRVLVQFGIIFFGSLLASLFLISQFVLPVHTAKERFNVFTRIVLYFLRKHGPAIFVREGKHKSPPQELESSRPGVAFVDPSSAIVLEKQWKPHRRESSSGPLTNLIRRHLLRQPEKINIPPPLVRAAGPGIVFTRFSERIIGSADLRKQFRINLNVPAYTADGLEMNANVFAIFGLGQPPDVLKVAYLGEEKPENLRILQVDRRPKLSAQGKYLGGSVEYIRGIVNELDPEDRSPLRNQIFVDRGEVHRYAQTKAEMRKFIDTMSPLSAELFHQFINSLNPLGKAAVHRFIDILYAENRAVLYRIIDKLTPIDLPEVGIYRFAFNRTILHQIIDEFENFLVKAESQVFKLRKAEKKVLHRFIDQLFYKYSQQVGQFYESLNQKTGKDIKGMVRAFSQKYWMPKEHPRPPKPDKTPHFQSPFVFDPRRVFHAVYARGRNPAASAQVRTDDWTQQPTQIATELYRQELSQIRYDDIYLPQDPSRFPLFEEIKPRFSRIMRHSGVLSFQLIRRRDGTLIEVGQELNSQKFILDFPVMEFRQPKPLRERGIRVIHASFTELKPIAIDKKDEPRQSSQPQATQAQTPSQTRQSQTSQALTQPQPAESQTPQAQSSQAIPIVRKQRFDSWQAKWQKESEFIKAESELELMHIRNRARAQAQQDMTIALSQILENTTNSQEAMAMRVFQALETAATDPSTHQLLPRDTIDMLRSLRHWLLPGGDETTSLFEEDLLPTEDLPAEEQDLTDL
jgi:hypothetical protein